MELEGNGVSKTDMAGLSNRLRTELFKTGRFTVIERGQMSQILKARKEYIEFKQSGLKEEEWEGYKISGKPIKGFKDKLNT